MLPAFPGLPDSERFAELCAGSLFLAEKTPFVPPACLRSPGRQAPDCAPLRDRPSYHRVPGVAPARRDTFPFATTATSSSHSRCVDTRIANRRTDVARLRP